MTSIVRPKTRRRSQLEISLCILDCARESIKPTRLMYAANLSWKPMLARTEALHAQGLLDKEDTEGDARSYVTWRTSPKGLETLRYFAESPFPMIE